MQVTNYSAVGNQPANSRFKNSPNFQGITIKQGVSQFEKSRFTPQIIPQRYIDAIMNSPEMKKAGEVYEIVVSAFSSRHTEFKTTQFPKTSKWSYPMSYTKEYKVYTPNLSFQISENTLGNKIRKIASKSSLIDVEEPKVYGMSFDHTETDATFDKVKNLTKTDIDSFIQQQKEKDKKMQAFLSQPKEQLIKVK